MGHRQRTGLGVIGVAVVLVAVIAGLHPHLVAGAAQAAPVPGPPAVGDCVLDPVPGPPGIPAPVTATSGGTVPVYPAQQIQPCTAARYGEIVLVIATPKPTVVEGAADGRYLADPNLNSCVPAAMQYAGMTMKPILGFWETYLQIATALSRPSVRQEAAGQHWVACIVTLQLPSGLPNPTPPRYGSSIRDALHTGRQRDQLGNCSPTVDWTGVPDSGGCAQPHALEILAYGDNGDPPVTRARLEITCQQLVRQLTAMADPAAAGALAIQVHAEDNSSAAITTAQIPPHSNLACGVATAGTRKLRGSLLALGHQPIPWA